jgi:peptide-methionine (S)-S-oxide reductase
MRLSTIVLAATLAALRAFAGDETPMKSETKTELATFGGGCFWCMEAVFEQIPGVKKVTSGYTGGRVAGPTYGQVTEGDTGHAEAIQLEFDPAQVSFGKLLDVFWAAHDPTQLNQQGNDVGEQYRSVIFYHGDEQRKAAHESEQKIVASGEYKKPIVTLIQPATVFYPAEGYHQEYYKNNKSQPYCRMVIRPKLEKLGLKP